MKKELPLLVFTLTILLASSIDAGDDIRLISSSEKGVVLELRCLEFDTKEKVHGGVLYHSVSIRGSGLMDDAGKPQAPLKGTLVAIPPSGDVDIETTGSDYEVYPNYNLYPAPKPILKGDEGNQYVDSEFEIDSDVYAKNAFYPGELAKVEVLGFMRDQRVARVSFFPIQFNPATRELRFYRTLRARLVFSSSDEGVAAKPRTRSEYLGSLYRGSDSSKVFAENGDYQRMLGHLALNYGSVPRREPGQPSTEPTEARMSAGTSNSAVPLSSSGTGPKFKVSVAEDGIYVITHSDLTNAGMNLSTVDPRKLKMTNQGEEIAIYILGEADGVLDSGDHIVFYGEAWTGQFTDENVYWLYEDSTNGLRMAERDGSLSGNAQIPAYFQDTVHVEENKGFGGGNPSMYDQEDYWWWDFFIAPAFHDYSVSLNNISNTAGQATLRVRLNGGTGTSTNPDHHTQIFLNGQKVDDAYWDGIVEYNHIINISQTDLHEGVNTVRVEGVGDTGSSIDIFFSNWIEIDYFDRYVAENDVLEFLGEGAGTFEFNVSGFTANGVEVYDITDPKHPIRITNYEMVVANPAYTLKFEDTIASDRRYVALTTARRKSPKTISADESSNLRSSTNGADSIIITYDDFYDTVQTLANHRASPVLRVKTIKITDVYDEFTYGVFDPWAIQYFLKYAYENWKSPAPQYILLVGDATYDYKNYAGTGVVNYVPTLLKVTSLLGLTGTDNPFVCVSGNDDIPDMFLGRIPVKSSSELAVVISKIIDYETTTPSNKWYKNVLFVADDSDSAGDFPGTLNNLIADFLPSAYNALKVYYDDYKPNVSQTTQAIIAYMNQGALITNYLGHGGVDIWAHEKIFQTSNIPSLNNQDRLTFLSVSSCYNGFFHNPRREGLAEELLRASNGGLVGAWAATGLSYLSEDKIMSEQLFKAVFQDGNNIMGAACAQAKVKAYTDYGISKDSLLTMEYFGDPLLELKVGGAGLPVHLSNFAALAKPGEVALSWTTESELETAGFDVLRSQLKNGGYRRTNDAFIPSRGDAMTGATYTYADHEVANGVTYYYKLQEVGLSGDVELHGPVCARPSLINPAVPPDGAYVAPFPNPTFKWFADSFGHLRIDLSSDEDFESKIMTIRIPKQRDQYVLPMRLWGRAVKLARRNNDLLYWRITGWRADSSFVSHVNNFTVRPSQLSLVSPDDDATRNPKLPLRFLWWAVGVDRPVVEICADENFSRRHAIRIRSRRGASSVRVGKRVLHRILALTVKNEGALWWRVSGREFGTGNAMVSDEVRRLNIVMK